MFFHTLSDVVGTSCAGRIGLQAVLLQSVEKCFVADLHDMRTKSAAQISDFFMSQFF